MMQPPILNNTLPEQLKEVDVLCDFARLMLLSLLHENPETAYDLQKKFQQKFCKNISVSFVYSFLNKLRDEKMATQIMIPTSDNKKKRCFSLTKKGRMFYENVLQRFLKISRIAFQGSLNRCQTCNVTIFQRGKLLTSSSKQIFFCCTSCRSAANHSKTSSP